MARRPVSLIDTAWFEAQLALMRDYLETVSFDREPTLAEALEATREGEDDDD